MVGLSNYFRHSFVWWNSTETENALQKMQACTTSLFSLIDGENQRLGEEVSPLTQ